MLTENEETQLKNDFQNFPKKNETFAAQNKKMKKNTHGQESESERVFSTTEHDHHH